MEVKGEDQVVAVEAQNVSPVQMGTVRISDLLAGVIQGKMNYCRHTENLGSANSLKIRICLTTYMQHSIFFRWLISALLIIFWKCLYSHFG